MSVCASVCKWAAKHTATYLNHERKSAADEAGASAGAARGDKTRYTLVGSAKGKGCERVCDKNNDNSSYPHSLDVRDGAVEFPHIPLKVQRVGFTPGHDGAAPELRLCVCVERGL